MRNVKAKGRNYERTLFKAMSLWFSNGKRDDLFWGTSSSGARATIRMNKAVSTANSCGDMCALDSSVDSLMNITTWEFKKGYSKVGQQVRLLELIDGRNKSKSILFQWIDKVKMEAKQHNKKHPIIVFRRDRKDSCIVFQNHTWIMLYMNNRKFTNHDGPISIIQSGKYHFVVIRLRDFFDWCRPEAFWQKVNKIKRRLYNTGKYRGKNGINYPDPL